MEQENENEKEKYIQKWRKQNPDYFKEYRKLNFEKLNAYHKNWVQENKEWIRKYQRERLQRLKKPIITEKPATPPPPIVKPVLSKTRLKQIKIGKELEKIKKKAELFKLSLMN